MVREITELSTSRDDTLVDHTGMCLGKMKNLVTVSRLKGKLRLGWCSPTWRPYPTVRQLNLSLYMPQTLVLIAEMPIQTTCF